MMTSQTRRLAVWLYGLLVFCGFSFATPALPAQAALLDANQPRIALWQSMTTLPDEPGVLTPQTAAAAMDAGQGGTLPSANHAYGKWIPYPYWARFSLHNKTAQAQSWLLTFESTTQDATDLWQALPPTPTSPQTWQTYPTLDHAQTGLADGQLFPVWRVRLEPGQTQTFMLRLDGYNLMRFPLYAMQDDAFAKQQRSLFLGLGFVLAIPLVVLLYVLTLIRIAEDKSLPIFIAMALAEMLGASWVSGLLPMSLPWIDRWVSGWLGWAGYILLLGLSSLHARVFLNTPACDKRADAILQWLAAAWLLILPIFVIAKPDAARLCLVFGGTLHALIMTWLSWRIRTQSPQQNALQDTFQNARAPMWLFTTVWLVYGASGLLYIAYRIADLPIYITLMSNLVQGSLVAALMGCAVSVQIIHQRRDMQKSVARAQDRNHLYATAHHDLWQPIQSVGLYAAALSTASDAEKPRFLRGIESAVTSVHDFMEGLRQVDAPVQLQTVKLHELLAPLINEYRLIASHKRISLRYRASSLIVQTDPALLQRMVRNLLSNSIRYTGKGGRVLLGCRRRGGRHWLMVYDNGVGMTPEQTAICFDAFVRVGDISRVPEGMGLGLYSVKRMANQLQAQTYLTSKLGVGTAIGVSLD